MAQIEILGLNEHGLHMRTGAAHAVAPKAMLTDELGGAFTQEGAEEWATTLSHEIAQALAALEAGQTPPAPFDRLLLEREV